MMQANLREVCWKSILVIVSKHTTQGSQVYLQSYAFLLILWVEITRPSLLYSFVPEFEVPEAILPFFRLKNDAISWGSCQQNVTWPRLIYN